MTRTLHMVRAVISVVLVVLATSHSGAAPKFSSSWTAPTNLGPIINGADNDFAPAISKDGLSLYFASDRPGGFGASDIWFSQRPTRRDSWAPPTNLGGIINTPTGESTPTLSRDGHFLFFTSNRPEGFGDFDIWVSWRLNTHDDFGWHAPFNLGTGVNSAFLDGGPTFFENFVGGAPYFCFFRATGLGLATRGRSTST
jgi:hypothetical protein